MTEDEAKTKWCPMVRVMRYPSIDEEPVVINRYDDDTISECACIASECMWWVWDEEMEVMKERVQLNTGHCGAIK